MTTVRPSRDTHRSKIASECTAQERTHTPLRASHRRTTPSLVPLCGCVRQLLRPRERQVVLAHLKIWHAPGAHSARETAEP